MYYKVIWSLYKLRIYNTRGDSKYTVRLATEIHYYWLNMICDLSIFIKIFRIKTN